MTLYYNLSNLINLYVKSLQWILNSFNVTKTHTILIYHILGLPDHFYVCIFVHMYICILNVCLRTIYEISMFLLNMSSS